MDEYEQYFLCIMTLTTRRKYNGERDNSWKCKEHTREALTYWPSVWKNTLYLTRHFMCMQLHMRHETLLAASSHRLHPLHWPRCNIITASISIQKSKNKSLVHCMWNNKTADKFLKQDLLLQSNFPALSPCQP